MFDAFLPLLIVALIVGLLYRRVRRLFGRNRISTPGFLFRIVLSGVLGMFLFLLPGTSLGARVTGVLLGLAVAAGGLLTTKTDRVGNDWFYTPNTYLGVAIASLILGRIGYRIWSAMQVSRAIDSDAGGALGQIVNGNPVGRVLILALLVYTAAYHVGLLQRRRGGSFPMQNDPPM